MTSPHTPIYINGRFLSQTLTGVQRFASEVTMALQRIHPDRVTVLVPDGVTAPGRVRTVGQRRGHLWEQADLPGGASDGILVNLGNTAPLRSRRQVVVIHDAGIFSTPEAYSWKFRAWYRFMQSGLIRSRAKIVTVSKFARDDIVRHLGVESARVHVISEGADHMRRIIAMPAVLASAGIMPGRFVLAVGSLAKHKNLSALAPLARTLDERGMALVVTGGLADGVFQGNSHDALPRPAHYLGRVSDGELKALYENAACFVFSSRYEGFGLPALEAMSCNCPVVVSDIPALREICGVAARYFSPADPADIERRVCDLLDDESAAADLRRAGAARVASYTWDRAAAMLDQVIGSPGV